LGIYAQRSTILLGTCAQPTTLDELFYLSHKGRGKKNCEGIRLKTDIFIGIDGGASQCKVRVEDAEGHVLGQAVGGSSNIRLSVEKTWQSIYSALDSVLQPLQISLQDPHYRFHAGMGLAGCEVIEARQDFLSRPHPFATLELFSDAHAACLGAHGGEDGAIIIIGTGVIGYQIQNGVNDKVGGWGFPHDDEGGGAWLGLEALRLTFQSLDGRRTSTPLLKAILDFFDRDIPRLTTWANRANSSEFARLAPLVVEYSQKSDPLAVQLMKHAATAVDTVGAALEKKQKHPLPCSLFGGITPFLEPWLSQDLRARLRQRLGDANKGAIWLIRNSVKAVV